MIMIMADAVACFGVEETILNCEVPLRAQGIRVLISEITRKLNDL